MILVDSSAWVDYFNGVVCTETDRLDALLGHDNILMGDIILTEVLQKFTSDADFRKAQELLALLPFREMLGHEAACRLREITAYCASAG